MSTNLDDLEKLHNLKKKGVISQKEFEIQKEKLLNTPPSYSKSKKQSVYCVLALFLGGFGIHNFYAGRWKRGLTQLFLWLLPFSLYKIFAISDPILSGIAGIIYTIFLPITLIWPIINIFAIHTDAVGREFEPSPVARCVCGIFRIIWCLIWVIILVIGGIAGYTLAMNRYRANEILNAAALVAISATSANNGSGAARDLSELGGIDALTLPCIDKSEDISSSSEGIVTIKINKTCPKVGRLVKTLSGNRGMYTSQCGFYDDTCIVVNMGKSVRKY